MRKRRPPIRPPGRALPLTEADRAQCDRALAQLYVRRQIDETQLARRVELLNRALTRADLRQVFEGLPFPVLATPPAPARPKGVARFSAEPAKADRALVVQLAKTFGVGVVFAGVIIATNPSMMLLLVLLVVTGGNMFLAYRDWAKKRRSE